MERQHPLLSPVGLVMTVVVLVIMGFLYWRHGGQMFSPGPLAAAHADIEDCAACHKPLESSQGPLCMECHTEIADEISSNAGLHARLTAPDKCLSCHPDHRGADFDLRAFAVTDFDHNLTFFSLNRHHFDYDATALECTDCHTRDDYTPDLQACQNCHAGADPAFMQGHLAAFGPDCTTCHDGVDRFSDFDHSDTAFPLMGLHTEVACADCHVDGNFEATPLECAACHTEPAIHAGLFQDTCADCHTPEGWQPALLNGTSFDHFEATGFSLVKHETGFDGSLLNCKSCHVDTLESFAVTVCEQCHTSGDAAFMAGHIAEFGPACLDCHDGVDAMENFDHANFFVLDGAHADLACTSCHIDQSFAGTPTDCAGCHAEPAIHAGVFGLQCGSCHATAAWQPARLTNHTFPLDHGGEGVIACTTCHPSNFVSNTCDACHAPAEMVQEHNKEDIFNIAGRCTECHPTGLKDEVGGDD